MTVRLVGLMSVVLVLCLASFGLVMHHYQDGVMREVEKIVSDVGQKTLRSFDFSWQSTLDTSAEGATQPASAGDSESAPPGGEGRPDPGRDSEERRPAPEPATPGRGFLLLKKGAGPTRVIPLDEDPGAAVAGEVFLEDLEVIRRFTARTDGGETRHIVAFERIRAESAPGAGLQLRIPTVREGDGESLTSSVQLRRSAPGATGDIVLPISTASLQALSRTTGRRSLLLFLAVLLLGTALSAALAHRFTRPARRLDAAIQRLSDGDLRAAVEVVSDDEIGRLGVAFNAMAHKLQIAHKRERELTRRERLSALGRLAAGVAHDVRNPLHSIGLTLQHIQETARPEDQERGREFDRSLGLIRTEIRRLDDLVKEFLRFARAEPPEHGPVDIGALLHQVAEFVSKEAERRGIRVQVDVAPELPTLVADAAALRSAVLNLVMNGFEAMAAGGTLSVLGARRGEVLSIEVRDTGRGIPEQEQERVFDFAYTTRADGHGLGLAMVHQVVVEDHGGQVSLVSQPGSGTTVRLDLPVRVPPAEHLEQAPA